MDVFFTGFEAVCSIFILIVLGYILTARGKIDEKIASFISWLVVNVTLPCYMLQNVLTSFDPAEIARIPSYVAYPFLSECLGLAAGFALVRLAKIEKSKAGSVIVMTALNNTIFMGLPVNLAMFGEASTPFVLYYYISNTLLFWTVGIFIISGKTQIRGGKELLTKLIPPPLYGLLLGIAILMWNSHFTPIALPAVVHDTLRNLGALTTPLSMIFIGHVLAANGLKNIRIDRTVTVGLLARFVLGPAIALGVFMLAPIPTLMKSVFTVQAFMPVMATQSIIAREYGVDEYFPTVMVSVSTLASLVILPLIRVLL